MWKIALFTDTIRYFCKMKTAGKYIYEQATATKARTHKIYKENGFSKAHEILFTMNYLVLLFLGTNKPQLKRVLLLFRIRLLVTNTECKKKHTSVYGEEASL